MIKYYFVDSATDEKVEQDRATFYSSLIYNLDVAVQYRDKTTYQALCDLKLMMNQERKKKGCEVDANGFYYNIEVVKHE